MAAIVGYLIGSVPTAGFLARMKGIDLRREGSGNPGANNALRTGGPVLAVAVLLVEAAKGYLAVMVGMGLADDAGAVAAGLAAVAGNVYNVWYRFAGGKGLGISLGVLAAAWPTVLPVVLIVLVGGLVLTRSAGLASLAAMVALNVAAIMWSVNDWPTGGVAPDEQLFVLAAGMSMVMFWKHWRDSPFNPAWRSARLAPTSPDRR